ncbi:hypothetical protein [Nocardiopsis alba]|uniref:hypothetical protein n=1 Tax=Nocardiopsis alba TaxID=53437 RepID=UPI0033A53838
MEKDITPRRTVSGWEWTLRVAVLAAAAALLWEFVTAGRLVTFDATALPLHNGGAYAVHVTAAVQLLAAAMVWFGAGRGAGVDLNVLLLSLAAFALGFVQAALGTYGPLQAHVPLALVLVALVVWSAVLAWSRRPAS